MAGIGAARAAQLVAAFELGRRLLADWPTGRWSIRGPRDVADRLILQMGRLEREELRVVMLDTKNHVLRVATVYQGNVSSSLVRVGELFRDAVRLNAAGVILVHNHPSGDPTPSPDDLHLTAEALAAGRLLDIQLLDHLVIGHDAYVSLRDRGRRVRPSRPPAARRRPPGPGLTYRDPLPDRAAFRPPSDDRVYCPGFPPDPAHHTPQSTDAAGATRSHPAHPGRADSDRVVRRTRPQPCSTGSSASSPATSGSTSARPTRWSTSATAASS